MAVLWAGLELMAALPLARPFSDRKGPLSVTGPWLPVMLPAAGFLVLWRHAETWSAVPGARSVALWLLLPTALLAAIRAFGLRPWTASLRWLGVADCALAGVLLALRVPAESSLLLWVGAFGGHSLLLASELGGSLARRSRVPLGMWRISAIMAITMLSWPVLVTLGFGAPGNANPILAGLVAGAVALVAWVSMRGWSRRRSGARWYAARRRCR
jgi:hypothetical protein